MKKAAVVSIIIMLIAGINMQAQKMKLKEGDLKFLKGQSEINVVYKYDDMKVGKKTEKEYIAEKTKKMNAKEARKGDTWAERWVEDREKRFEPKFEDLLNKILSSKNVTAKAGTDGAKYTMTVHTTWTEPGFYGGVVEKPAYLSGFITFCETASTDKVLAKIEFIKAPGNSFASFDTGERIKEAYAKLGKTTGKFLAKKAFK